MTPSSSVSRGRGGDGGEFEGVEEEEEDEGELELFAGDMRGDFVDDRSEKGREESRERAQSLFGGELDLGAELALARGSPRPEPLLRACVRARRALALGLGRRRRARRARGLLRSDLAKAVPTPPANERVRVHRPIPFLRRPRKSAKVEAVLPPILVRAFACNRLRSVDAPVRHGPFPPAWELDPWEGIGTIVPVAVRPRIGVRGHEIARG
mmetsp:Transcript_28825/g.94190  ORF Transcript_28825/g.94190 Transcript_28825/m.94190 type:complete len:211 (+) Transcript_28825:117-749(+)